MTEKPQFKFLPYFLIFTASFLLLQSFQKPREADPILSQGDFAVESMKSRIAVGKELKFKLANNTDEDINIDVCGIPPVEVLKYTGQGFEEVTYEEDLNCVPEVIFVKQGINNLSLKNYSYRLLGEEGRYKLRFTYEEYTTESPEFEVKTPSFLTLAWRNALYIPILNALVALLAILPGHPLWLSIILLTLLVRIILHVPSMRAMQAQKKMQSLQPKLESLKEKYKNDQTKLAQETMSLWKTHKVHPLSSCLPVLIQFPILIALFYVVNGGLGLDKEVLIYAFNADFSLQNINPYFFNFNLLEASRFVFPIAIGLLQFAQLQLMFKQQKNKSKMPKEFDQANKMMRFIMPAMIAFFTSQLPAAVGLYWGFSTFYGIIQQLVVNREGAGKNTAIDSNADEVEVRVIKKSGKK